MSFSKKRVEDRKRWLSAYEEGTFLDQSGETVRYDEFINKELILFSLADLMRSIPSAIDGFKPSQRKVMFSCFKRKLKSDIKVAQLSGYVSEHSAYHHGEASLASTIVNLAQDFVGTNNINLLVPSGQFGTRLQGGKDHASPRYIFTRLAQLARVVFPECDDALLNYNDEDGQKIEPTYYMPVIPTVLINGAEGIGTGWSTSIPNYNARDVISNVRAILNEEEPTQMMPWYRHFKGEITEEIFKGERRFIATGSYHIRDECTLEITELPLRTWTQDYKEFLEELIAPKDKKAPFITDYKEYHTDTSVHFVITMPPANLAKAEEEGIVKKFKLASKISCSNMHAFNEHSIITKYESAEDIMKSFVPLRLKAYEERRQMLIKVAESELKRLANKTRFILAVVEGSLVVNRKKKAELVEELEMMMYDKLPKTKTSASAAAAIVQTDENDIAADESDDANASYDYLLSMPLWNLTLEKVEDLVTEKEEKEAEVALLRGATDKDLWFTDLDALEENLDQLEDDDVAAEEEMQKQVRAAARNNTKAGQKALAKKKKAIKKKAMDFDSDASDSEIDEDFSDDDFEVTKPKKRAPAKPKAAPLPPHRKQFQFALPPLRRWLLLLRIPTTTTFLSYHWRSDCYKRPPPVPYKPSVKTRLTLTPFQRWSTKSPTRNQRLRRQISQLRRKKPLRQRNQPLLRRNPLRQRRRRKPRIRTRTFRLVTTTTTTRRMSSRKSLRNRRRARGETSNVNPTKSTILATTKRRAILTTTRTRRMISTVTLSNFLCAIIRRIKK